MPSNVYIVNRSAHDYSPAREYGELVYLSDGPIGRYEVNNTHRQFWEILRHSDPYDYLVPCGLTMMNMVAASIMGALHGRLNLLLFSKGKYIPREIVILERRD